MHAQKTIPPTIDHTQNNIINQNSFHNFCLYLHTLKHLGVYIIWLPRSLFALCSIIVLSQLSFCMDTAVAAAAATAITIRPLHQLNFH